MPCRNVCVLVTQSWPTLGDPLDCRPPGSSVQGILQERILERIAISFSRGSSWPKDWTPVCCNAGSLFTDWGTRGYRKGDIIFWLAADSMGLCWIVWANLLIGLPFTVKNILLLMVNYMVTWSWGKPSWRDLGGFLVLLVKVSRW